LASPNIGTRLLTTTTKKESNKHEFEVVEEGGVGGKPIGAIVEFWVIEYPTGGCIIRNT
jgi:hypothetical protein